jgi:hypothetical protein
LKGDLRYNLIYTRTGCKQVIGTGYKQATGTGYKQVTNRLQEQVTGTGYKKNQAT